MYFCIRLLSFSITFLRFVYFASFSLTKSLLKNVSDKRKHFLFSTFKIEVIYISCYKNVLENLESMEKIKIIYNSISPK